MIRVYYVNVGEWWIRFTKFFKSKTNRRAGIVLKDSRGSEPIGDEETDRLIAKVMNKLTYLNEVQEQIVTRKKVFDQPFLDEIRSRLSA